jgi:hypothetical protein
VADVDKGLSIRTVADKYSVSPSFVKIFDKKAPKETR